MGVHDYADCIHNPTSEQCNLSVIDNDIPWEELDNPDTDTVKQVMCKFFDCEDDEFCDDEEFTDVFDDTISGPADPVLEITVVKKINGVLKVIYSKLVHCMYSCDDWDFYADEGGTEYGYGRKFGYSG
jgi:hypothetical protein